MKRRYHHHFDTEHLKGSLKQKSIRGGLTTLGSEGLTFFIRIGSIVILARLLMPAQFGLISMVTAVTGFALLFKDLGLSDATIQSKELSHEKVSNLFWINTAIGLLIALIIAASSPLIAILYAEPRLSRITLALSISFIFSGLTVQHQALLYRQMRFGQLAIVNILSHTLSLLLGIILALKGYGYWALVIKEISLSVFIATGTWLMSGWIPSLPRFRLGLTALIRFGRDVTGFNIVNYLSRSVDRILIGRNWGPAVLGIYDRALQLMIMPLNQIRFPITRVAMSGLSALQDNPVKYRKYYSKLISILCFIYMPMVVYLGIYSKLFIHLVLGEKWIDASYIFRVLALVAFIQPVTSTCDIILVSRGQTKKYFVWGLVSTVLILIAYVLGVKWGAIGVAWAYMIANYILFFPSLWYRLDKSPISISLFFGSISLPILASLIMGTILIVLSPLFSSLGLHSAITFSSLTGIMIYIGVWLLWPGGKKLLKEYIHYFKEVVGYRNNIAN